MVNVDNAKDGSGLTNISQRSGELVISISKHINALNTDIWWQDLDKMVVVSWWAWKCPSTNKTESYKILRGREFPSNLTRKYNLSTQ